MNFFLLQQQRLYLLLMAPSIYYNNKFGFVVYFNCYIINLNSDLCKYTLRDVVF